MGCKQYQRQLQSYLDDELSPQELREMEAHVKSCNLCSATVLAQGRLKREIRLAGKKYAPTLEFRRRVEAQIAPARKYAWLGGWAPQLAFAAVLFVVVFATGNQVLRYRQAEAVTAEMIDVHVATLASAGPMDIVSTDRHTVKPWFQGRIPFTFNLPELRDSGFTLLGGRVTYLSQAPAAQLLFEIRKHKVSVFIQQGSAQAQAALPAATNFNAFAIRSWKQGGLRYLLVTDASPDDADALTRLLKSTS